MQYFARAQKYRKTFEWLPVEMGEKKVERGREGMGWTGGGRERGREGGRQTKEGKERRKEGRQAGRKAS